MMAPREAPLRLLADIGGTNARFALQVGDGGPTRTRVLACAEHPDLYRAMRAYLEAAGGLAPTAAALAVAAPVSGDRVEMTNSPWSFSIGDLRQQFSLARVDVVNDFTALALSLPHLGTGDRVQVGGGHAQPRAPLAVIGPGTGLGVSGLVPDGARWTPLDTEGGHVTLAPADERESAVLAVLRRRFGHVSAERVLSGPGLVNLCSALAEIAGDGPGDSPGDGPRDDAVPANPDEITRRALEGDAPLCATALETFCAMLGTVASNLALTLGALGGVYIAGGIVPRLGPAFAASPFRARFEDKGRFSRYLAAIPTFVIHHQAPALLGLAALPRSGAEREEDRP